MGTSTHNVTHTTRMCRGAGHPWFPWRSAGILLPRSGQLQFWTRISTQPVSSRSSSGYLHRVRSCDSEAKEFSRQGPTVTRTASAGRVRAAGR